MASDQPDGEQIRAAVTDIDTHLDEAAEVVDLGAARTFIGVAGTVTTLTAGRGEEFIGTPRRVVGGKR